MGLGLVPVSVHSQSVKAASCRHTLGRISIAPATPLGQHCNRAKSHPNGTATIVFGSSCCYCVFSAAHHVFIVFMGPPPAFTCISQNHAGGSSALITPHTRARQQPHASIPRRSSCDIQCIGGKADLCNELCSLTSTPINSHQISRRLIWQLLPSAKRTASRQPTIDQAPAAHWTRSTLGGPPAASSRSITGRGAGLLRSSAGD